MVNRARKGAIVLPVVLSLVAFTAQTARAEKWPGDDAPPGGAIAAKVIGQSCSGALAADEVAELEAYIRQRRAEFLAGTEDQQHLGKYLFPKLEEAYADGYSDPQRCTEGAAEMARDMLQRVRKITGQKL